MKLEPEARITVFTVTHIIVVALDGYVNGHVGREAVGKTSVNGSEVEELRT